MDGFWACDNAYNLYKCCHLQVEWDPINVTNKIPLRNNFHSLSAVFSGRQIGQMTSALGFIHSIYFAINKVHIWALWSLRSVTILGDILDFGQLFKAIGNN